MEINDEVTMINRIKYTKPFLRATSTAYLLDFKEKLEKTLTKFPELEADYVYVGVTTSSTANAQNFLSDNRIKIGYNPSVKPTYFVLGHELTHFVQDISNVPYGEKPCDIYTIARDPLFLDRPPAYLTIKKAICDNWSLHAKAVRALCIEAIKQRANGRRQYIVWLEKEIARLE